MPLHGIFSYFVNIITVIRIICVGVLHYVHELWDKIHIFRFALFDVQICMVHGNIQSDVLSFSFPNVACLYLYNHLKNIKLIKCSAVYILPMPTYRKRKHFIHCFINSFITSKKTEETYTPEKTFKKDFDHVKQA